MALVFGALESWRGIAWHKTESELEMVATPLTDYLNIHCKDASKKISESTGLVTVIFSVLFLLVGPIMMEIEKVKNDNRTKQRTPNTQKIQPGNMPRSNANPDSIGSVDANFPPGF